MNNFLNNHISDFKQYIKSNYNSLLKNENVTSVGVGFRRKGENQVLSLEPVLQFTVKKKIIIDRTQDEKAQLEAKGYEMIEKQYMGFPTDVIERSFQLRLQDNSLSKLSHYVRPGARISSSSQGSGTLGAIVYKKDDPSPLILTNQHVLPENDVFLNINGKKKILIGKKKAGFINTEADVAIATLIQCPFNPNPPGIDLDLKSLKYVEPEIRERVIKVGATSRLSRGIINRIEVHAKLDYPDGQTRTIRCFEITPRPTASMGLNEGVPLVSAPGDSGSLWYYDNLNGKITSGVGLHVAGESGKNNREFALACYLSPIFEELELTFTPHTSFSRYFFAKSYDKAENVIKKQKLESLKPRCCSIDSEAIFPFDKLDFVPFSNEGIQTESQANSQAVSLELEEVKNMIGVSSLRKSNPDLNGKDLTAVIIDTGIFEDHQEFKGKYPEVEVINLKDLKDKRYNKFINTKDTIGHGSHIAGIISGAKNGIAPLSNLLSIKIYDKYDSLPERVPWLFTKLKNSIIENEYKITKKKIEAIFDEVYVKYYNLLIEKVKAKKGEEEKKEFDSQVKILKEKTPKMLEKRLLDIIKELKDYKSTSALNAKLSQLISDFEIEFLNEIEKISKRRNALIFEERREEENKAILKDLFKNMGRALEIVLEEVEKEENDAKIAVVCIALGDITNNTDDRFARFHKITECIRKLRQLKIPVVISAGNAFIKYDQKEGMNYPSIIEECVSVGAVFDTQRLSDNGSDLSQNRIFRDEIIPTSQRLAPQIGNASQTTIFAPGGTIQSASHLFEEDYTSMSGTSMAAGVISGAILLLQQAYFKLKDTQKIYKRSRTSFPDVDELVDCMRGGALALFENEGMENNKPPYRRLDLEKALEVLKNLVSKN